MTTQPPHDISPDGHEVWDWATRLSKIMGADQRIFDLRNSIANYTDKCGECTKWMTLQCPLEVKSRAAGRVGYPHMNMPACAEYVETASTTTRLKELRGELEEAVRQRAALTEKRGDA